MLHEFFPTCVNVQVKVLKGDIVKQALLLVTYTGVVFIYHFISIQGSIFYWALVFMIVG